MPTQQGERAGQLADSGRHVLFRCHHHFDTVTLYFRRSRSGTIESDLEQAKVRREEGGRTGWTAVSALSRLFFVFVR
jgi:hypothetical protein